MLLNIKNYICILEIYDELLKPPTIDEQVEDFIKEFFEEGDSEPLEQKDFLAEFFEEISENKFRIYRVFTSMLGHLGKSRPFQINYF